MKDNQVGNLRWRYADILATALIVITVVYLYVCWGTPTTILLVRHADRQGCADALSTAALAQELSRVLGKSGIYGGICTREATHTRQTCGQFVWGARDACLQQPSQVGKGRVTDGRMSTANDSRPHVPREPLAVAIARFSFP